MFPKLPRKSGAFAYICSQMFPKWEHLRTLARFWEHLRTLVRIRGICLFINHNQYRTYRKLLQIGKRLFIKVFSQSLDLVFESFQPQVKGLKDHLEFPSLECPLTQPNKSRFYVKRGKKYSIDIQKSPQISPRNY